MAKIIKVGSQNPTFTSKANPFKTARNSTTNPFKYSNFEGNTLQFADVFEGFEPKAKNKLKMIASSVTGSMNKLRSSITEPIVNFVNRVRGGITAAWDYTVNKKMFELPGEQAVRDFMTAERHLPSINFGGLSVIGKGISSKMDFLNKDVTEILNQDITGISKNLSDKWTALISKIHTNKISADTPVSELEMLWKNEIALESREVA